MERHRHRHFTGHTLPCAVTLVLTWVHLLVSLHAYTLLQGILLG